jgi:hypothetical protein
MDRSNWNVAPVREECWRAAHGALWLIEMWERGAWVTDDAPSYLGIGRGRPPHYRLLGQLAQ